MSQPEESPWTWTQLAVYWALMYDARTNRLKLTTQADLVELLTNLTGHPIRPATISEAIRALERRGLVDRRSGSRRLTFHPPDDTPNP